MANQVVTELTGKNTTLNPVLAEGERLVQGFGDRTVKIFTTIAAAISAAFAVNIIKNFVSDSIAAAIESEEAWAKWNATQIAAGDTLKLTNEQLSELASNLQETTRFEDEAVVNAASLLSVYENLNSEAFERTIRLGANMAALFGGDLQSSVQMLGRSLNDPITGLRALRQAGVALDEATKDLIKTLVEQGDIAGAQEILFEKLEKRFEGVAEAMGETAVGRAEKLKNRYGELKEQIGGALIPTLEDLLTSIEHMATGFEEGLGQSTQSDIAKVNEELTETDKLLKEIAKRVPNLPQGTTSMVEAVARKMRELTIGAGTGEAEGLLGEFLDHFIETLEGERAEATRKMAQGMPLTRAITPEQQQERQSKDFAEEMGKWADERLKELANREESGEFIFERMMNEMMKQEQQRQLVQELQPGGNIERRGLKAGEGKTEEDKFVASFESLIDTNRRITAATANTPEAKIERAVIEAGIRTVEKLDALTKPLEGLPDTLQNIDEHLRTPQDRGNPATLVA